MSALITGATSPIGIALAKHFSEKNIPLFLTGRDEKILLELQRSLKNVEILPGDLTKKDILERLCEKIAASPFSYVINNAGIGLYGRAIDLPIEQQLAILKLNCEVLMQVTLTAAKALQKEGRSGIILNVSSAAALFPYPTFAAYAASKSFVKEFSLALDAELRPAGIRVLCACPGQIATRFRERAARGHPQKRSRATMTPEQACAHLLRQIEKEKPLMLFDWRYKWGIHFLRMLPRGLRNKILIKSIEERYAARS